MCLPSAKAIPKDKGNSASGVRTDTISQPTPYTARTEDLGSGDFVKLNYARLQSRRAADAGGPC
jgi:hypothetical protein